MRRAWTSLVAMVLVLSGCKATEKKSPDREAPGTPASRTKGKNGPTWLDEMNAHLPGGGGAVPKADSWNDPRDPNTDFTNEVRGLLGGVVVDPDGHRAGNVTIQIEPATAPAGPVPPAPMSIVSDSQGYFLTKGLKAGQSYTITVRAASEGRTLVAVQQTRVPNPNLTIKLRDDIRPASPTGTEAGPGGLPPASSPDAVPGLPPTAPPSNGNTFPPPPADLSPPSGGATNRPADGSWSPGGASSDPLHKIVPTPVPSPTPTSRPVKPENVATDPRPEWRAPPASIPTPPLPTLPPPISPIPPAPTDPARLRSAAPRANGSLALVDTLNRPWSFENRTGKVVLLDFMTTTCLPCKKSIPTLSALQSRYGAYGLQIIAVACDEKPQDERVSLAAKYTRDFNLNYALYTEPGQEPGSVRDRFRVDKYPTAVLLDESGNEVWRGHPADGAKLEAAIRQHIAAR